jgi:hypothetical protein
MFCPVGAPQNRGQGGGAVAGRGGTIFKGQLSLVDDFPADGRFNAIFSHPGSGSSHFPVTGAGRFCFNRALLLLLPFGSGRGSDFAVWYSAADSFNAATVGTAAGDFNSI